MPTITADELFPLGGGVELVRDGEGLPSLALLNGDESRINRRIEIGERAFAAPEIQPSIFHAITWPSDCRKYGSTHNLFKEVFDLLSDVTRLCEPAVTLIAFFVLATWFVDVLPVVPCMWVLVPPAASGEALRQILRLLCRRALPTGQFTMAGLRSLPMTLRPTILAEASRMTPDLVRALQSSNRPNTYVPVGKELVDLFCAKVIFADQPLPDRGSVGLPLEIALPPTGEYAPPLPLHDEIRISGELQPKLLRYRLQNHNLVAKSKINVLELTGPMQELARMLASCIVDDDELQSRVVTLLKPQDAELQADRRLLLESIMVEALLTKCHEPMGTFVSVTETTQMVNTILTARGDARQVSPETVGWALRRLGLHTENMADGRKGLALSNQTLARIQELAAGYGIRT